MKQKYVPPDKRSKKKQKEYNDMQRKSWGCFSPITRKTGNAKIYNRKKSEPWHEYPPGSDFLVMLHHATVYKNYISGFDTVDKSAQPLFLSGFLPFFFPRGGAASGGFFARAGRKSAAGSCPIKSFRPALIRALLTIS